MNVSQFFALFVWPFVALGVVLLLVWFTGWQDRREDARRAAAHPSSGSSPNNAIPKPDRPT